MKQSSTRRSTAHRRPDWSSLFGLLTIVFLVLHFLPLRNSDAFPYFWGMHFTTLLDALPVILGLAVALLCIVVVRYTDVALVTVEGRLLPEMIVLLTGVGLFVLLAILFNVNAALLGDGYLIVTEIRDFIAHGYSHSQFTDVLSRQFLSVEAVSFMVALQSSASPQNYVSAYSSIGLLAGGLYIFASAMVIRQFAAKMNDILVGWLIFFSLPVVVLFLNYLEQYALVASWLALYLAIIITRTEGKATPCIGGLMAGLGMALHVAFIAVIPAQVFYTARRYGARTPAFWLSVLSIPAVYVSLILIFEVPWKHVTDLWNPMVMMDRHIVGILRPTGTLGAYSILSMAHAIDLVNLFLLVTPIALILTVDKLRKSKGMERNETRESFFRWAVGFSLLIVLLFNSDIGMSFDWDILSILLLPLAWYGILKILEMQTGTGRGGLYLFFLFVLIFHQIVWLLTVSSDESLLMRTERMALSEELTPAAGREAAVRNMGWYHTDRNNPRQTERLYLEYLRMYPESRIRSALASFYERYGRIPDAIDQFRRVVETGGYLFFEYSKLGELYSKKGEPDSSIRYLRRALDARPNNAQVLGLIGFSYAAKNELDSAEMYADRAIRAEAGHYIGYYVKGLVAQERKDTLTLIAMCDRLLDIEGVPPDIHESVEMAARMLRQK